MQRYRAGEGWSGQIDPHTDRWTRKERWGYGVLAFIPLFLLMAVGLIGAIDVFYPHGLGLTDAAAILLYTHFAAQFLVLAIFGKLLIEHETLSTNAKIGWGIAFLCIAPVAVIAYWLMHVVAEPRPYRIRVADVTRPAQPTSRDTLGKVEGSAWT